MVKGNDENKIFWQEADVFDGTPGMVRADESDWSARSDGGGSTLALVATGGDSTVGSRSAMRVIVKLSQMNKAKTLGQVQH